MPKKPLLFEELNWTKVLLAGTLYSIQRLGKRKKCRPLRTSIETKCCCNGWCSRWRGLDKPIGPRILCQGQNEEAPQLWYPCAKFWRSAWQRRCGEQNVAGDGRKIEDPQIWRGNWETYNSQSKCNLALPYPYGYFSPSLGPFCCYHWQQIVHYGRNRQQSVWWNVYIWFR